MVMLQDLVVIDVFVDCWINLTDTAPDSLISSAVLFGLLAQTIDLWYPHK